MSWGTPFADGYGKSPTNHQELMEMMFGQTRGRYRDRGYAYLGFDESNTDESKVVYSLIDLGQSGSSDKGSEWENTHRKGEFEIVGLETEDVGTTTVRFDKGSQLSDSNTRVNVEKSGRVIVGIWTLEWQRDASGKLKSLVATANSTDFKRRPLTG